MKKVYENSADYREVPSMTRSEYVDEYGEITDYYEKQRAKEKKFLPIYIIIAVLCIGLILYWIFTKNIVGMFVMFILTAPFSYRCRRFYRHFGLSTRDIAKGASVLFLYLFPLGSYIIRIEQLNNAEEKQIQELEEKKALCISLGTYDVEE